MTWPDVAAIADGVSSGACSARERVDDALDRIQANARLGAFIHVDGATARAAADEVDRRAGDGESMPLAGVPIAVKDNICVKDVPTTCASRMLADFVPPYDATVIERLRAAGAVILGKTNMDEFAMGSSNENSSVGAVLNPWDNERVPGGSSGGSAAAVAAGLVPVALGSDTGGSIRQPASFCGTVGFKPTYGRVSRYGLVAFGSSLDQIGPLTTRVSDAAAITQIIAGGDPHDATCSNAPVPEFEDLHSDIKGLRVGVPREYVGDGIEACVRGAVTAVCERLEGAGAVVTEVSLPHTEFAIPAYYVVATSEASSNLARFDGVHYGRRAQATSLDELYERSRTEGLGPEVRRRILLGTFSLSAGHYDAHYDRAMRARTLIRRDFDTAFHDVDVLLSPTAPTPAFRIGEKAADPVEMYLADILTVSANLAGVPGLVVPERVVPFEGSTLPVGVQLMGPMWSESTLLRVGAWIESTRPTMPEPEVTP